MRAALVAVPPSVVTEIRPVTAVDRTRARISVEDITLIIAEGTPPMVTCVAPVKFVPLMVTISGKWP
jgi:hypothetical protein